MIEQFDNEEFATYTLGKVFYSSPPAPFSLNSKCTLCCPIVLCDSHDFEAQLSGLHGEW